MPLTLLFYYIYINFSINFLKHKKAMYNPDRPYMTFGLRVNYSLTAPILTPVTKYFCKKGYNNMNGRIAATIPALYSVF